jgi:hypothetical protein
MAAKGGKQDDGNAENGINQRSKRIIQLGCNHRGQCNADYHSNQLESLAEGIGFGAENIACKQVREQGAVVCIDKGIQCTCQDICDQKICKQQTAGKPGRGIVKCGKTEAKQNGPDYKPGPSPAPAGPGTVRKISINRIVNCIDEGIDE